MSHYYQIQCKIMYIVDGYSMGTSYDPILHRSVVKIYFITIQSKRTDDLQNCDATPLMIAKYTMIQRCMSLPLVKGAVLRTSKIKKILNRTVRKHKDEKFKGMMS